MAKNGQKRGVPGGSKIGFFGHFGVKNSLVFCFRIPRWGAKVARRGPQQGPRNPPKRGVFLRQFLAKNGVKNPRGVKIGSSQLR